MRLPSASQNDATTATFTNRIHNCVGHTRVHGSADGGCMRSEILQNFRSAACHGRRRLPCCARHGAPRTHAPALCEWHDGVGRIAFTGAHRAEATCVYAPLRWPRHEARPVRRSEPRRVNRRLRLDAPRGDEVCRAKPCGGIAEAHVLGDQAQHQPAAAGGEGEREAAHLKWVVQHHVAEHPGKQASESARR